MKKFAFIGLLLISLASFAQEFKGSVSKMTVAVGERFTLEYKTELGGASFTPPEINNAQILSGPNMSESSININGKRSRSFTVNYILRAISEGSVEIGRATLSTKQGNYSSEPIVVKVTKQSAQNNIQAQSPQQNKQENNEYDKSLFLKLYVDNKTPFVGEEIIATYKLYWSENIVDYIPKSTKYNGFYSQVIDMTKNPDMTTETINGKQMKVATFSKVILTPQKAGELIVDPMEVSMKIRVIDKSRGRDFFGRYAAKDVSIEVISNKEILNVKPLPSAPSDFDGAVGTFDLTASVDRTEINANEAVNLTVTLSGNGNIELLSDPKIDFPKDFEVYDPKVKKNISYNTSGASGKKTFEYVVIPRFGGEFEIKPITLSYFNPKTEKFVKLETDPITLKVAKGNGSSDASVYSPSSQEDVQILGKDIRFIKTDQPTFSRSEKVFFKSFNFYLAIVGLLFAAAIAWFLMFFLRKQKMDGSLTSKRAGGVAKKHLAEANKLLSQNAEGFYEAIAKALFGYISDKLSIPRSNLNRENIAQELANRGIQNELISELTKALDECEMVRFAPGIVRGKQEMLQSSKEIIEKIENEL